MSRLPPIVRPPIWCSLDIFSPIAAADGGVLTRADKSEATTDLAAIAGMLPAAVFTEVLDKQGNLARGESLWEFARSHDLPVGRVLRLGDVSIGE